jgi:hypothetical protein
MKRPPLFAVIALLQPWTSLFFVPREYSRLLWWAADSSVILWLLTLLIAFGFCHLFSFLWRLQIDSAVPHLGWFCSFSNADCRLTHVPVQAVLNLFHNKKKRF